MPCFLTRHYDEFAPSILYQDDHDSYFSSEKRYHLDFERYYNPDLRHELHAIEYDGWNGGEDHVPCWIGYS